MPSVMTSHLRHYEFPKSWVWHIKLNWKPYTLLAPRLVCSVILSSYLVSPGTKWPPFCQTTANLSDVGNSTIFFQENVFEIVVCKMSPIVLSSQCVKDTALTYNLQVHYRTRADIDSPFGKIATRVALQPINIWHCLLCTGASSAQLNGAC